MSFYVCEGCGKHHGFNEVKPLLFNNYYFCSLICVKFYVDERVKIIEEKKVFWDKIYSWNKEKNKFEKVI